MHAGAYKNMDNAQNEKNIKEIREAIDAADYALSCLYQASDQLRSASNWGIVDMIGGGFLTSLIKRDKMSQASACMDRARMALESFSKEVRDVNNAMSLGFESMDFIGMADLFFDNFLVDWMVQSKIGENRRKVEITIDKVTTLRNRLEAML